MIKILQISAIFLLPILGKSQVVLSENFDGDSLPATWTVQQTNPAETWHADVDPISGAHYAAVNYDDALGDQDEWLITPSMDLTTSPNYKLKFKLGMSYYWGVYPYDNYDAIVNISTDNGATWTQLWTESELGIFTNYTMNPVKIDLSSYSGNSNVKIAFQYVGTDAAALYVDDFDVSAFIPPTTVPDCATLTSPVNAATNVSYASAALSWTAAATADSYDVYLDTNANPTTLLGNYDVTTVTTTNLLPSTVYYCKVIPKNALGDSTGCTVYSFTTTELVTVPDCVMFTGTGVSYNSATLYWGASFYASSYDVYLDTNENPTTLLGNYTDTTATATNLSPSTAYYWKVIPKNIVGDATGCTVIPFTTTDNPATPYCPLEILVAEPITLVNFAGINNTTDPIVDGTPGHEIFLDQVAEVTTGQSYDIILKGNTDGDATDRFVVFIDWNQDGALDGAGEVYEITQSITNSTGIDAIQAMQSIAVPSTALAGNTRMRVKKIFENAFEAADYLRPCSGAGYGQAEDYTVHVTSGLATAEVNKNAVKFYPNPVVDILNIDSSAKIKNIEIYSVSGELVLSKETSTAKNQINLSKLSSGIYLVKAKFDNEVKVFKIIKK